MSFSLIYCSFKNNIYSTNFKSSLYEKYIYNIINKNSTNKENIIVISNDLYYKLNSSIFQKTIIYFIENNLEDTLYKAYQNNKDRYIYVIADRDIILQAINRQDLDIIHHTIFNYEHKSKVELPEINYKLFYLTINTIKDDTFMVNLCNDIYTKNPITLEIRQYTRIILSNHFEISYFQILKEVLNYGKLKNNRTDIKTISKWGEHLEIDLSEGFPLITTKFVPFKGLVNELLFFISGKTDTTFGVNTLGLNKDDIKNSVTKIWFDNTTREFLDKRGLTDYKQGEACPIYGFQWRHFGSKYIPNKQLNIGEEGIDQLQNVIDGIKAVKTNPSDPRGRRLIVNSWNPIDLDKMCLPPCHYCFQFSVENDTLNLSVNMRSSDLFLGLPWNMNYALLNYMIAHLTELQPGKLVFNLSDAHIYVNCIEQVKEQLTRNIRTLPKLEITRKHNSIDEFTLDSFKLINYNPHPTLLAKMAI